MRPLPRNLDRPNRVIEMTVGFVAGYYAGMFLNSYLMSLLLGLLFLYGMYKLMKDKPEGMVVRMAYKVSPFEMKFFLPSPKLAPRLEI